MTQKFHYRSWVIRTIRWILLMMGTAMLLVTLHTQVLAVGRPVWSVSDTAIDHPESVYYSATENAIFVSSVVGEAGSKDGQGWISKVSLDGRLLEPKWVEGLHSPHGMRAHNGILWVADIDELVGINLQTGQITARIQIPGAAYLNDIAIDKEGKIFISDTLENKIFIIQDGQVSVFASDVDLEFPNGLLVHNGKLLVAGWGKINNPATFATDRPGHLFQLDLESQRKEFIVPSELGNLDGIETTMAGNLLVSDYNAGKVFLVNPDRGQPRLLISGDSGIADIGLVPSQKLLLVPNMVQNKVDAYRLP